MPATTQLLPPGLCLLVAAALLGQAAAADPAGATAVWVEGESAATSDCTPNPWYSEAVQKGMLSGAGWITNWGDRDGTAAYKVAIPAAGDYTLWVRANPVGAKLAWRMGGAEWKEIDTGKATDQVNLANDSKPDLRFLAWIKVGLLALPAGELSVDFKFHSDNHHHGALDCFLFTTKPFIPNGMQQPAGRKADISDQGAYVWTEGEDALRTDAERNSWYSDAVKKEMLSGNGWLSSFTDKGDATADYELTIPKDGDWTLWVRANPVQSALAVRIGTAGWAEIDTGKAIDMVNLANDSKPDLRFIAWIKAGVFPLKAGKLPVSFKFHSANHHHGALDCFVFASKPFAPSGKSKPGVRGGEADQGWWAFEPAVDEFGANALLDLRTLNEKEAGINGHVTAKGDVFLRGDGQPIRFWAVNGGPCPDHEQQDYLSGRLAKCGVNLARLHGGVFDRSASDPLTIDAEHLDHIHYAVSSLKKQGIYVHLSTYFPLWIQLKASDGIPGAALGKNPFCLLFFEPRFQELYKGWAKQVLLAKNPYTGRTLADDPAVAFWEIQNEDSMLFWTFGEASLGAGPFARLEQLFGAWAAKRYGAPGKALEAWGEKHAHDDAAAGRLGLYGAWDMTGDGYRKSSAGKQRRITDQVHFIAELQRDFYASMKAYITQELGFKGLVTASNWTTADNTQLGGIERWCYTAADVVDKHNYFGGEHKDGGDGSAGFSVRVGHTYTDRTALTDPASAPFQYLQIAGRPHIHTEIAWNKPNRFVAEGTLLTASYAALQGVGGYFWFATGSGNWANDGGGNWTLMMPGELGQFPAAALQYRRGDLKPGPVVLRQLVTPEEMFAFKGSGFIEGANADFRTVDAPKASDAGQASAFDPFTYFVGRAERVYTDISGAPKDAKPVATDLAPFIDRTTKRIASATGELVWDYGIGLLTVNSPRSAAVTGFLAKAGTIRLGAVTITSDNEYATIQVISLDGEPLAKSRRMLIQSFTEEKMYGFRASNGRIEDVGRAPINVRDVAGRVAFADGGISATACDEHGYARGPAQVEGATVTLPRNALYVVVTR
jgi:hypothetical protein